MIDYSDALSMVLRQTGPLGVQRVRLEDSPGCVLARPLRARYDSPRFSQSAMDGYAVRAADLRGAAARAPVPLELVGAAYAGRPSRAIVRRGTAVGIMTGAPLPRGADTVVMKEVCTEHDSGLIVREAARRGDNVRRRGEEYRKRALLLPAGTRITPPVIGLVAAAGHASVTVYRKPTVVLIVTGDELRRPGQSLRAGEIHDSNSPALAAALQELGIGAGRIVHTKDRTSPIRNHLRRALSSADVLITVGGVSVGDRDLVKPILEELGVHTLFWKVAIKPGKPNYFGVYRPQGRHRPPRMTRTSHALVFGLPGNPVSALLSFHQLVKPALLKILGLKNHAPGTSVATLAKPLRKKAGRLEWVRGVTRREDGRLLVTPTAAQESHMLTGLAQAECLIDCPVEQTDLRVGADVNIRLLEWRQ
ncbi:MAG: gephyrin-like molybdotransferase Glp [Candidatus Zixiibacteriota bacterium]